MTKQTISQIFDLSGKTAIVTGGSAGIGQGIAQRLAEAGASVMIVGRNGEAAKAAADEIRGQGGNAASLSADVGKVADTARIVAATMEAFGALDILVNNAALFPIFPTLEVTEENWDQVLDTNLKGPFFLIQAAAKEMIRAGRGGKIINISSVGALRFQPQMQLYGASKGGLDSLTKHLAGELAPYKIHVNAVHPGVHITPGVMKLAAGGGADQGALLARIPLGRPGEPDDTAKVVLFLASSASDYMTGGMLDVEGGWMAMA